jgi:hypothetical protein
MWIFTFIFLIPITLAFLVISGGCLVYFFMGLGQLTTGYKENNRVKIKGGVIAIIISMAVIITSVYFYRKWIWI